VSRLERMATLEPALRVGPLERDVELVIFCYCLLV
jgi:hypothetical protein